MRHVFQPAVEDYVEFDLFCRLQEPNGENCLKIIDPYEYIDDGKFTQPKLLINATGDQFFLPDGSIRVQTYDTPDAVRLWQATNPDARDFRIEEVGAIFTSSPLSDQGGGVYIGYCPPPAQGWTAFLVELDYGGVQYTTEVAITPDTLPYEGTACQ